MFRRYWMLWILGTVAAAWAAWGVLAIRMMGVQQ